MFEQNERRKIIQDEKATIERIAEWEAIIAGQKGKVEVAPEPELMTIEEIKNILEGTYIEGGERVAIINGKIYEKGDVFQNFLITEILQKEIYLQNINTKVIERLSFPRGTNPLLEEMEEEVIEEEEIVEEVEEDSDSESGGDDRT